MAKKPQLLSIEGEKVVHMIVENRVLIANYKLQLRFRTLLQAHPREL